MTNERTSHPAPAVAVPFAAIVLAMLPAVLDQTILATALPTIALDLGRVTDVAWLVTAYVVAAAASTPLWGKLGDRHGRKRLLEISLGLFLAASALCGAAPGITSLIVARAIQGVAAGGLMTLAMAAVGDLVSPRERARYQGYIAATFAAATVAGPLMGGVIVQHVGWRWVFYVNLPIGLAALAGLRLRLPAPLVEAARHALDVLGAALLATATAGFILICVWGGRRYPWGSPEILALAGLTCALAFALVLCERRAADPIVPFELLRTGTVAIACAALFLTTAALFAVNVFVPLYLQTTTGATPTEAGLLLVPMMLGITVSTNLAGRGIARTGRYKRYPVAGAGADDRRADRAGRRRRQPVAAHDRDRPGRVRSRVRHGRPGAGRRRPERRRSQPHGRRDGRHQLLPRPGWCRRRGAAGSRLRVPGGRLICGGARGRDRRRAGGLHRRRTARGGRARGRAHAARATATRPRAHLTTTRTERIDMADSDGRYDRNRGPRDRSLRAGDGDRDAFAAILREQHLAGRLDSDEFQERLDACMAAKTYADLDRLVTDLPAGEASGARPAGRPWRRRPWLFPLLPLALIAAIVAGGGHHALVPDPAGCVLRDPPAGLALVGLGRLGLRPAWWDCVSSAYTCPG